MNKQTYPIPEGCKAITMEIIDNTIVTTFEPEFKRGDVIYCEDNDGFSWVFILREKINRGFNPYEYFCSITSKGKINTDDCCRHPERIFSHATPEEAQRLWDALAKEGKRWNPETMEVEEIKKELWRADCQRFYFFITDHNFSVSECMETSHLADCMRYNSGNYFQTEEQAQRAANRIKTALSEFWKEELK